MILSDADKQSLPALYSTENTPDPPVKLKLFVPWGSWTWYVTEGEQKEDDFIMFGLVDGHDKELVSLAR
jgi:hypothetical protein